jgi:hypothetical protein
MLAKSSKCLQPLFSKDLRFDNDNILSTEPAVDPETILWENLGTPTNIKSASYTKTTTFTIFVFLMSLTGIVAIALFEKH